MAPRVTPLEGVYTYCFAIRGRGVENPQGFGIDERRLNTVLIENHFHTKLLHSNYKTLAPSYSPDILSSKRKKCRKMAY